MDLGFITVEYVFQVLCTALGFFTFIKLISNDVYIYYHRLLPTIAAIITIYDFYLIIMPFSPDPVHNKAGLCVLCDMCSLVTMFMLFFYLCYLRKPKMKTVIVVVGLTIMIGLCLVDFIYFNLARTREVNTDLIAVIVIAIGTLLVGRISNNISYFDNHDRYISRLMLGAFYIALAGYLIKSFFPENYTIMSTAFAIDCAMFYVMAYTNRIEDTSAILGGKLFDLLEYPVCLVNKDFYIVNTNKAGFKTFPYAKDVEFCFENNDYRKKFVLGQRMVEHEENDKELKAGNQWYRIHWTQVDGEKGVKGYIFTASNITEQHEQMQMAKTETAEKSQFLAHMSHELRSPLHAIIGVSDILLGKHDISTKNRALVQHIKKASDGLLDLVDAILDFSKLEAGKFEFAEKKYNIDEMLEDLAYNNIVNLGSKPVDFAIAITSDYPKFLYGDAMRVREVIQNLLSNAVKYTDTGSVRAEFSFEDCGDDRVKINFKVVDTGYGMSPDMINEIFSEYTRINEGTTIEGSGLGLSITQQIINKLDGEISAESDGVSGSTFMGYFYQKIGGPEYLSEKIYNRRSSLSQTNGYATENIHNEWIYPEARVLVADDMRINQEIMKQLLAPWGCKVDCVSDGSEAISACRQVDYQLILLDQMMAPMNGLEASVEIRKITDAPIVLVTANTEDNVLGIIEKYGLTDFMGKPVNMSAVHSVLDTYMPHEFRQKNFMETNAVSSAKKDLHNLMVYKKTLETFVREMQPLLLHLSEYVRTDRDLFRVKVHGVKGVSRQIGRDTFAEEAEIMEMAAKSDHWNYVERHMDEFLTSLCDVVEDVTAELTQIAPNLDSTAKLVEEEDRREPANKEMLHNMFKQLLEAFDSYDIGSIESIINQLNDLELESDELYVFHQVKEAYDELEYDMGSTALIEYFENH